ncbi:unnamed protein product [Lymnaea stagnalis]|uniref:EF-hand domain-containing protein n=1 Tax=Lymnaea stagnalis TaxID=6523 RepID=A0AAV2I9G2_LYMST
MSFLRFFKRKKDPECKKKEKKDGDKKKHRNFFKGRWKKEETQPVSDPSIETRKLFYTAEFHSLGDVTRDDTMTKEEFYRLMMLLGYPDGVEGAERIWLDHGQEDGGRMTLDQYIALMFDDAVDAKTNCWRKLFANFDPDGNAFASKSEVIKGLQNIGLDITPEMRKIVDKMDTNKDGKISYEEFLKAQLKQ